MARNIRWQITFKSLNGTTCRVDIYDNDWPAGVILPVRGAADPFYYEEDNSDDLLNGVLRYRTGYIRVVENYYGQLDDMRPEATFDRYVEFLYGGVVVFNGYIQVQDFSHTLEFSTQQDPCPHVVEFPVISPLGLFEKRTFSQIAPPTTKTLGQLMDLALAGSAYQKVVFPNITGANFGKKICSLVVSPWNKDYHHSMTYDAFHKVMKPKTYAYLFEGICKAYGWICHDTPQALVFTEFNHTGQYCSYPIGHIAETGYMSYETLPASLTDITDYYTMADDSARVDTLLPDTGIEVSYEGESGKIDFSFDRTTYNGISTDPTVVGDLDEVSSVCNLWPVNQLWEMYSIASEVIFNNDGTIQNGAYCVAWKGMVGLLNSVSGVQSEGDTLWTIRLYTKKLSGSGWKVSFETLISKLGTIQGLKVDDDIKNLYVNHVLTIYDDYVEVVFKYHYDDSPGSIVPRLSQYALLFIHDIKFTFMEHEEPFSEYRFAPATDSDYIPSLEAKVSSSITMPFSMYRLNDHMIGDSLVTTKLTEYPYLLQKRLEFEGKFRAAAAQPPSLMHARMYDFIGRKWRMIAQSFRPWDDEYELTMQYSPTFEPVETHTITANADYTSLEDYSDTVNYGASFSHLLTPDEGYEITSVVITMGGSDITGTAYDMSTGQISIASVTGDVVITAVAETIYDAEVEWLRCDSSGGIAYINTGIPSASNVMVNIECSIENAVNTHIFGGRVSSSSKQLLVYWNKSSNRIGFGYGSETKYWSKTLSTGDVSLFNTLAPEMLNIYGHVIEATAQTFSGGPNIYLFALNNNGGAAQGGNAGAIIKMYSAKFFIFQNNNMELVRDYIPVRKNGVGYLFDRVSGELFGNANSRGSFTYGNDVNS